MKPPELLKVASLLAGNDDEGADPASIHRAISTAYYAMFHHLAQQCADLLIGSKRRRLSNEAWRQVYRSLEHGHARGRCKNKTIMAKFPKAIEDYGSLFVTLQGMRHEADYDPIATFSRSEAVGSIDLVRRAIEGFAEVPIEDRRAFCVFVLLRDRKD